MQIPATSSASQAASIAAQAASKDGAAEAGQAAANAQQVNLAAVEKANESSADRDAQGQGDGLSGDENKPGKKTSLDELEISGQQPEETQAAPQWPDQPPGQLDITG